MDTHDSPPPPEPSAPTKRRYGSVLEMVEDLSDDPAFVAEVPLDWPPPYNTRPTP
jgi:hypothetical protein